MTLAAEMIDLFKMLFSPSSSHPFPSSERNILAAEHFHHHHHPKICHDGKFSITTLQRSHVFTRCVRALCPRSENVSHWMHVIFCETELLTLVELQLVNHARPTHDTHSVKQLLFSFCFSFLFFF